MPVMSPTLRPVKFGLRVGRVRHPYKVAKYFNVTITGTAFRYARDAEAIEAGARIDGLYGVRTSVGDPPLSREAVVRTYKGLSVAERAFRSLKTVDLKVRPIHHRLADRVRTHVFLCLLAHYVEWHMRRALAPLLFDDDDPVTSRGLQSARTEVRGSFQRGSVVAPARRSPRAEAKAATKRTAEGHPVHSFQTLLADLATLTRNLVRFLVSLSGFLLKKFPEEEHHSLAQSNRVGGVRFFRHGVGSEWSGRMPLDRGKEG